MGAACAAAASARPWLVTALGVAALILALVPASRVGFDASVEGWFLPNDTTLERYQESRERFGHDEFLLVVLEPARGDVFQNEVLVPLSQLAARLDADSLVTRVHGIHNAVVIQAVADTIRVEPALGELPLEAEALDRALADLLSDPRAAGFLVAPDAAHAVLVVDLEAAGLPDRLAFAERVEHLAGEYRSASLRIHVMGDVVLHRDLYLKVQRDMRWVLPLLGLMLLVVLGVAFRSPLAVVLCLGVVGTSVVGARALMAALGWGDSPLLTLVPVVLVVTGVADAVHVLDRYLHARGADTEPAEACSGNCSVPVSSPR